jgi:hypothetical protein
MTSLPKASPLSGLPDSGAPASNTDENTRTARYSVKHPTDQQVVSRIIRQLLIWRKASQKSGRTRKRIEAARAAAGKVKP